MENAYTLAIRTLNHHRTNWHGFVSLASKTNLCQSSCRVIPFRSCKRIRSFLGSYDQLGLWVRPMADNQLTISTTGVQTRNLTRGYTWLGR